MNRSTRVANATRVVYVLGMTYAAPTNPTYRPTRATLEASLAADERALAAEEADLAIGRWPHPNGERTCRRTIDLLTRSIAATRAAIAQTTEATA